MIAVVADSMVKTVANMKSCLGSILLVCVLLMAKSQLTGCMQICGVDEDSRVTTLSCPYSGLLQNGTDLSWKVSTSSGRDLYKCTCKVVNGDCDCPITESDLDGTSYEIITTETNSGAYSTQLRLRSVGREHNNTTVVCSNGDRFQHTVCDVLLIYKQPETPSCTIPGVTSDTTHLEFTCATERTFPQADVEVRFSIETDYVRILSGVLQGNLSTCKHEIISNDPIYYKSQCLVSFPVNQLPCTTDCTEQNYDVYMYPVLATKYYSPSTRLLQFEFPPETTTRSTATTSAATTSPATTTTTATITTNLTTTAATNTPPTTSTIGSQKDNAEKKTENDEMTKGIGVGAGAALGLIIVVVIVVVIIVVKRRGRTQKADGKRPTSYAEIDLEQDRYTYVTEDYETNWRNRPTPPIPLPQNTEAPPIPCPGINSWNQTARYSKNGEDIYQNGEDIYQIP